MWSVCDFSLSLKWGSTLHFKCETHWLLNRQLKSLIVLIEQSNFYWLSNSSNRMSARPTSYEIVKRMCTPFTFILLFASHSVSKYCAAPKNSHFTSTFRITIICSKLCTLLLLDLFKHRTKFPNKLRESLLFRKITRLKSEKKISINFSYLILHWLDMHDFILSLADSLEITCALRLH